LQIGPIDCKWRFIVNIFPFWYILQEFLAYFLASNIAIWDSSGEWTEALISMSFHKMLDGMLNWWFSHANQSSTNQSETIIIFHDTHKRNEYISQLKIFKLKNGEQIISIKLSRLVFARRTTRSFRAEEFNRGFRSQTTRQVVIRPSFPTRLNESIMPISNRRLDKRRSAIGEQCRSNYRTVETAGRARACKWYGAQWLRPGREGKRRRGGWGKRRRDERGRYMRVGEPRQGCTGSRVDAALQIFVLETRARGRHGVAAEHVEIDNGWKNQFNEPERFHTGIRMHIVVCVRAARLVNKTINAERRLLFLLFLLPARIVFGEKSWDQLVGDCSRQRDSCFEIHVRIASSRISLQSISNTRLLSPPSSFAPFPLFVFPCQSLIARSDGFDFATGIEENRSPGARARARWTMNRTSRKPEIEVKPGKTNNAVPVIYGGTIAHITRLQVHAMSECACTWIGLVPELCSIAGFLSLSFSLRDSSRIPRHGGIVVRTRDKLEEALVVCLAATGRSAK